MNDGGPHYNTEVIARGIREFMARDWAAVRAAKDRYWHERIDSCGPLEALRIADDLRRQVMRQQPGWPDVRLRAEDLDSHVGLAQLLRRVRATRGR